MFSSCRNLGAIRPPTERAQPALSIIDHAGCARQNYQLCLPRLVVSYILGPPCLSGIERRAQQALSIDVGVKAKCAKFCEAKQLLHRPVRQRLCGVKRLLVEVGASHLCLLC